MLLQIMAYSEDGYETMMKHEVPNNTDNWERILRKMYEYTWKHCNQNLIIDLFAVMIDEDTGFHECGQAWALEYNKHFPNFDLPFI